jgi:cobalt-zinc-cadmium efflux system outer membrane protein
LPSPISIIVCLTLSASEPPPSLTLGRSVELALERNASIQSARADVAAARARVAGASVLLRSNPEVEGSAGPRRTPDGRSTDVGFGISQQIEIFGQRGARVDAAEAFVASAEARLESRRVEVAAEVREAFARRLAAAQRLRMAGEAVALAEEALRAAEARLRSGAASVIELNAARSSLGQAIRERAVAIQREASAVGAFTVLVGLDPRAPVELEGDLATTPGEAPSLPALVERALAQRPEIRSARHEVEAARAERRLAGREALPSPRLGVTYSEEGDVGGKARITQGILSFDLPLFNRNQGERGVATARLVQAERALDAITRAVHTEVGVSAARLSAAAAAAQAYAGGLLTGLEENMELVNEAYRAGKVGFFELLVIRRETLDARIGYIDALEELQAARAQLARAIGSIE